MVSFCGSRIGFLMGCTYSQWEEEKANWDMKRLSIMFFNTLYEKILLRNSFYSCAQFFLTPFEVFSFYLAFFWQHMLILQTSTLCKPCRLILTRENELWIMVNIKLSVLNQMTWLSLKWCRVTEKSSQTIIISNF